MRTAARRLRDAAIPISAMVFAACCAPACSAQDGDQPGVSVIRPTDNGFEDLLQAGGPAVDDPSTPGGKIVADAEAPTATLTQRLAAMHEPAFRNALASFRSTMGKPITPSLTEQKDMGRFNMPLYRLGRLLAIEQYVLLSEGKVPAALDSFADSLALGDLEERWSLLGMIGGVIIEERSVRALAAHLDQLSERDCSQLFSLLKTELGAPNPAVEGIHRDAAGILAMEKQQWNSGELDSPRAAAELNRVVGPGEPFRQEIESSQQVMRILLKIRQDPNAWSAFQSDLARDLMAQADGTADALANYPSPPSGITAAVPATDIELAAQKLAKQFDQPHDGLIERDVEARTYLQLLAVHAAILRWRWEANVVPDNLSALHLGSLATDVYTGQPLIYTRLDQTHYTLTSAGPPKRDTKGGALPGGARVAISL